MVPPDIAQAEVDNLLELWKSKKQDAKVLEAMYKLKKLNSKHYSRESIALARQMAVDAANELKRVEAEIVKKRGEAKG